MPDAGLQLQIQYTEGGLLLGAEGVYAVSWGCCVDRAVVKRGENFVLSIDSLNIPCAQGGIKIPLMGVSGVGKSALLNFLSGMEWPHSGSITWAFPDSREITWGKKGLTPSVAGILRRKYFGFAFQDSSLLPHLKVKENLLYPLEIRKADKLFAMEKAEAVLHKVLRESENLGEILEKYPYQLSGGQRQRISMVQAMIHDPYVLFADEPTGSLDSETRRQVMNVLVDWVNEGHGSRLLLWVTHHDNDPSDNHIYQRLHVNAITEHESQCMWQELNSEGWVKL